MPGLFAYRYDSPLFFPNAENFRRALAALDACTDDVDWFVLNMRAATAAHRLRPEDRHP